MSLMISASGIRGIVGESLTAEVTGEYAAALGTYIAGGLVVVGRDSRPSGPMLQEAVTHSLLRCGCPVIDLGVASTPAIALRVRQYGAAAGIILTASHNPAQWNGIKFLTHEGLAPPAVQARQIWQIREQRAFRYLPAGQEGNCRTDNTAATWHVETVLATLTPARMAARRYRVVLDSVNGAGGQEGRLLLEALDCQVTHINAEPTGQFAHPPEPLREHLQQLCATVREQQADIGFAQDPDADRVAIVDEHGEYIGEEFTLALAAKLWFSNRPGALAANLSTSRMVDDLAAAAGPPCRVVRTAVGEANVVSAMQQHHCLYGGEGNGGVIDPRVVPVRNSLVGMSSALELMAGSHQPLSALVAEIPRYHMIKQKFPCDPRRIQLALQCVRDQFADEPMNDLDGLRIDWPEGWVHVRGSNTEPLLRLIAESRDAAAAQRLLDRVRQVIQPLLQ